MILMQTFQPLELLRLFVEHIRQISFQIINFELSHF
jgi:hypothetical protein